MDNLTEKAANLARRTLKAAKTLLYAAAPIAAIILAAQLFGPWGIAGLLISCLVFGCVMVWLKRDEYMRTMRTAEVMIWGKSLDRENWQPGELRKTPAFWWKKQLKEAKDNEDAMPGQE